MSRVAMAAMPWGVFLDASGAVQPGVSVQINNRDGSPATHWSTRTGGSSSTAAVTTNASGTLTRFIEGGEYTLTVGAQTIDIDAVSGAIEDTVEIFGLRMPAGAGSPEGVVAALPGAVYEQIDGADGKALWTKQTGAGNTGWRLVGRVMGWHADLFAHPKQTYALDGPTANTYTIPGSAASANFFEFYAGWTARPVYAVWQLAWTPGGASAGAQLNKFDPGPASEVQIAEITGVTGGPRNDSALITTEMQTIIGGISGLSYGGAHKQIGHKLKGTGSVAPLVYLSRVSMLCEV